MNTEALEQQQVPITRSEALYLAEQEGGNLLILLPSHGWLALEFQPGSAVVAVLRQPFRQVNCVTWLPAWHIHVIWSSSSKLPWPWLLMGLPQGA